MAQLPSPVDIKATVDAGQAWWAATVNFAQSAWWVPVVISGVAAHLSAWSTTAQKIPGLNWLGGNYGKATSQSGRLAN